MLIIRIDVTFVGVSLGLLGALLRDARNADIP